MNSANSISIGPGTGRGMGISDSQPLQNYIREKFCDQAGLKSDEVFGSDLTLAEVISRSERMTNSVDLMEAFARTANALRKDHGLRVRLPALALDTRVSMVLDVFMKEIQQQKERTA